MPQTSPAHYCLLCVLFRVRWQPQAPVVWPGQTDVVLPEFKSLPAKAGPDVNALRGRNASVDEQAWPRPLLLSPSPCCLGSDEPGSSRLVLGSMRTARWYFCDLYHTLFFNRGGGPALFLPRTDGPVRASATESSLRRCSPPQAGGPAARRQPRSGCAWQDHPQAAYSGIGQRTRFPRHAHSS